MKLAICILAHHKPWLISATLMSLLLQGHRHFDLHIIYIKGDGNNRDKETYKKFYEIADKDKEFNPQMSPDDPRIISLIESLEVDITFHEVENDHGLDSGAWYKFIRKGSWKVYDYCMFLMEGSIFTTENVLSGINKFQKETSFDFLSVGHEKRYIPKSIFTNFKSRAINPTDMDVYHEECMNVLMKSFQECKDFRALYQSWSSHSSYLDPFPITQHHVPSSIYPLKEKIKFQLKSIIRKRELIRSYESYFLEVSNGNAHFRNINKISNNVKNYEGLIFHEEISPFFFGCSCQHIFSNRFLRSLDTKLQEFNLYEAIDRPFSGTALELIWGFMPKWLGYKKWFFNGFHRPRKDFLTYERNDDVYGIVKYLNSYYKKSIKVAHQGDFLTVKAIRKTFSELEIQFSNQK